MVPDDFDRSDLLSWYSRHVGPPDGTTQVYGGFVLFLGGLALSLVGVATFLWSTTYPATSMTMYTLREVAGVAGATGLPLVLLGATVLLPVGRRGLYAAVLGTLVCVAAVVLFTAAYPHRWNVPAADASARIVPLYAAGTVLTAAATGAALVTYHLQRASAEMAGNGPNTASAAEASAPGDDETDSITDEQVRRDIDEAMSDATLTWGGVEKSDTKRLELNTDVDVEQAGLDSASASESRATGESVEKAVSGLNRLRGAQGKTATGQGTDDQATALAELREREQETEPTASDGVVDRIRSLFDRR